MCKYLQTVNSAINNHGDYSDIEIFLIMKWAETVVLDKTKSTSCNIIIAK